MRVYFSSIKRIIITSSRNLFLYVLQVDPTDGGATQRYISTLSDHHFFSKISLILH